MKVIATGRLRTCAGCGQRNPVLSFRFTEADVELAACPRCDWLRAKNPKELR